MSEAKETPQNLMTLITHQTNAEQLAQIVGNLLTPEDEQILGGKVAASTKVADSIAYLGAFVPAPATFDKGAFFAISAFGLSEQEAEKLWEIDKRIGVLKEETTVGEGRVSVSSELVNAAKNQFLTDN